MNGLAKVSLISLGVLIGAAGATGISPLLKMEPEKYVTLKGIVLDETYVMTESGFSRYSISVQTQCGLQAISMDHDFCVPSFMQSEYNDKEGLAALIHKGSTISIEVPESGMCNQFHKSCASWVKVYD